MVSIGAGSPIGRDPYDSAASRRVRVLQAVDQKQVPEHRDPGKSMYSAYILHIHTPGSISPLLRDYCTVHFIII